MIVRLKYKILDCEFDEIHPVEFIAEVFEDVYKDYSVTDFQVTLEREETEDDRPSKT
jgi:hypothetical protein